MSIGGRSLHKEDWLTLAGLAAIPVGGGMMGMGPLAGLLGSSAGAEAATALGIGLGAAPGEAAGAFTGLASAAPTGGLLGGAGKGLDALMRAQALMQLAAGNGQPTMAGAGAPKKRKQSGSGLDYFEQIYPTG
jgi:hypothetical protein